jgi:hypothetical protein
MFWKNIGLSLLAVSALLFMAPGARAGDEIEWPWSAGACNDADIEQLDTTIQCNGANWNLSGFYDVEVEDPASGSQYDLVVTLKDCNHIPSDDCGSITTFTVPLDTPSELDADDNDEIEFEGTFNKCVPGDLVIEHKRLRVYAEVVERCNHSLLDKEEDKVAVIEPDECKVACGEPCAEPCAEANPCDPCATRTVAMTTETTTPCDPCSYRRSEGHD